VPRCSHQGVSRLTLGPRYFVNRFTSSLTMSAQDQPPHILEDDGQTGGKGYWTV